MTTARPTSAKPLRTATRTTSPDECEPDCDNDGTPDDCEVDCNNNGTPDDCETFADCNANNIPDECDIDSGTSSDLNGNGIPDECECFRAQLLSDFVQLGWPRCPDPESWGRSQSPPTTPSLVTTGLPANQFGILPTTASAKSKFRSETASVASGEGRFTASPSRRRTVAERTNSLSTSTTSRMGAISLAEKSGISSIGTATPWGAVRASISRTPSASDSVTDPRVPSPYLARSFISFKVSIIPV